MLNRRSFIGISLAIPPLFFMRDAIAQQQEIISTMRVKTPVVVSTWDSGVRANAAAWPVLNKGGRSLDAVEAAARSAEDEISCCVGLDAYPDRDGKVTPV